MKIINKYLHFLLMSIVVIACNDTSGINKEQAIKNTRCEFTTDNKGIKDGSYKCFYSNGNIREVGTLTKDTIKIYENLLFYPSGQLRRYSFYNPIGELRFQRAYGRDGKLLHEEGDFLSHDELSNFEMNMGDSCILTIFVASPPNVTYQVFGVGSKGRYEMTFEKSDTVYFVKKVIYGRKAGEFIFPYEVEVRDTVNNTIVIRKSDVSFRVHE